MQLKLNKYITCRTDNVVRRVVTLRTAQKLHSIRRDRPADNGKPDIAKLFLITS